jgi:hypothetical protein
MISLTVALGYVLAGLPNIELMTLTVVISGYLLGVRLGVVVGAASAAVHAVFNPLGASLPPLLVSQVVGFAAAGAAGGLFAPLIVRVPKRPAAVGLAAGLGFALTLFYDVVTSVGGYYTLGGGSSKGLTAFVVAGVAFTIMHVVWNTLLFLIVLRPMLAVLGRFRYELS